MRRRRRGSIQKSCSNLSWWTSDLYLQPCRNTLEDASCDRVNGPVWMEKGPGTVTHSQNRIIARSRLVDLTTSGQRKLNVLSTVNVISNFSVRCLERHFYTDRSAAALNPWLKLSPTLSHLPYEIDALDILTLTEILTRAALILH